MSKKNRKELCSYISNTKATATYTDNEIKLITAVGYGKELNLIDDPVVLYRMCVVKAFMENQSGPHVEALRRGYNAITFCSPYRKTEEFEKLIAFEDSND